MERVKWAGSVALVTGASSGLGVEFARQLAGRGVTLVLVARSLDKLEEVAAELRSVHKGQVQVLPFDLAQHGAGARLCDVLAERGLVIDHLINNAGAGRARPVQSDAPETLAEMVALNCMALLDLTARLIPGMLLRGSGGVLQVASVVAFNPCPYQSVYAATKAFVLSFTEGLAVELSGKGVRVTALCPGHVRTGFQVAAGFSTNALAVPGELSAERTVAIALSGYERGKVVVVPGLLNRMSVFFGGLLPRSWVARISANMLKKLGRFD